MGGSCAINEKPVLDKLKIPWSMHLNNNKTRIERTPMILNKWKLIKVGFILEVLIYLRLLGKFPASHISLYLNWNLNLLIIRGNKVVMDRAQKKAKIVIRNWECGIVCSSERMGFGSDSWNVLKRFMIVDEAVPVIQVGKPWIREESGAI